MPDAAAASQRIPSRHGADLKEGRRMAQSVGLLVGKGAEPTPAGWQALGEALTPGHPVAPRVASQCGNAPAFLEVGAVTAGNTLGSHCCIGHVALRNRLLHPGS